MVQGISSGKLGRQSSDKDGTDNIIIKGLIKTGSLDSEIKIERRYPGSYDNTIIITKLIINSATNGLVLFNCK